MKEVVFSFVAAKEQVALFIINFETIIFKNIVL